MRRPPRRGAGTAVLLAALALALLVRPSVGPDAPPEPQPSPSPSAPPPPADVLVWGHGGISEVVAAALRSLPDLSAQAIVSGDRLDLVRATAADGTVTLDLDDGWLVPLDAQAADPSAYAPFTSAPTRAALAALAPGEVLIGATSAALRGIGAGGTLTFADGTTVTVAAVVPDADIGWAEVFLAPTASVPTPRYALVRSASAADGLASALAARVEEPLRVVDADQARFRRHGDDVLPQVLIKRDFGEFELRDRPGREFAVDDGWYRRSIVVERLPLVGRVVCHRDIIAPMRAALQDLADRGLGDLVEPDAFGGCWVGRVIGTSATISHHSWGVAFDINVVGGDPFNAVLDPRLVEAFTSRGFAWGGSYLRVDPVHFEWIGES